MKIKSDPYDHSVLDEFIPLEKYEQIKAEASRLLSIGKTDESYHLNSKKIANHRYDDYQPDIREYLSGLYLGEVKDLVEEFLGRKVYTDLEHNWGGGFHFLEPGGFLNMHIDFNIHPHTGVKRVANAILYLNDFWKVEDGGNLRLLNKKTSQSVEYTPEGNRLVIFPVGEENWHGNPEKNVSARVRSSFAMYFYVDADVSEPHSTIYMDESFVGINVFRKYFWIWLKKLVPKSVINWFKSKFL